MTAEDNHFNGDGQYVACHTYATTAGLVECIKGHKALSEREQTYHRLAALIQEYLGKKLPLDSPAIEYADRAYRQARLNEVYDGQAHVFNGGNHHA